MPPRPQFAAAALLLLQGCVLFVVTLAGLVLGALAYIAVILVLATCGLIAIKGAPDQELSPLQDWAPAIFAACLVAGVAAAHLVYRRARRITAGGDPALVQRH